MSMQMFSYANALMQVYKHCADLRGLETGDFKSATSGLMVVLIAMHLCDYVAVFGVGEPSFAGVPYQYFAAGGKKTTWSSREIPHSNHNLTLEGELLETLAEGMLIRRCKGGSGCTGLPKHPSVLPPKPHPSLADGTTESKEQL